MKFVCSLLFLSLLTGAFAANAQDYVLLPENFFLGKGEILNVHLFTTRQFMKDDEIKYQPAQTEKFMLYEGSKKQDLTTTTKDSAVPVVSFADAHDGLALIEMNRKYAINEQEKDDYVKYLDDEEFPKLSEKAKIINKDNIREKYHWYLKSLLSVEKPGGNLYDKDLKDDFEIILKQNPYKFNYGDDITALVNFKGKPLANASVILYVKTHTGNVFPQKLATDAGGNIYFKLSREGIYLLRTIYIEPSADKNADFETWMSSYTFAFSSSNELPNTYKEFGFGNKH